MNPKLYQYLRIACIALFAVGIPLLVYWRFRNPKISVWLMLLAATLSGWVIANVFVLLQHLTVEAWQRLPQNGLGEFWLAEYEPALGLIYGPVYLLCCWGAWLLFRRSTPALRPRIWLLAGGVFLIEWMAMVGLWARSWLPVSHLFMDLPFLTPQLTLPLALVIACSLAAWLPASLKPDSS